jgi:hypothetical protein
MATGRPTTLRLRLSKKTYATLLRALKRRRIVKAALTVTATDAAGNRTTRHRTVRLVR